MNYIYIVTWCLVFMTTESIHKYDEFGRYLSTESELVENYDCYGHLSYFDSLDLALEFIERADKESDVVNVKLDSFKIRNTDDTVTSDGVIEISDDVIYLTDSIVDLYKYNWQFNKK